MNTVAYPPFSRPLSPRPASALSVHSAYAVTHVSELGPPLDRLMYAAVFAFVFCIPWAEDVQLMGGLGVSRWVGVLAFGIGLLRAAVTRQARQPSVAHSWMWAFVAWSTLSLLWSNDVDGTATRIGTYLQLLGAVWLIWESGVTETRVLGFMKAYVLGGAVSAVVTLLNFFAGRTAATVFFAETGRHQWETDRFTVYGVNENDLGLMLALTLPMTFYLLARLRGPITVFLLLHIPVCVTAILLTGSRGSLIATIVACAMYPLAFPQMARPQRIVSLVAFAGVAVGGMLVIPSDTWLRLLSFGTEVSEGTMTHRTVIWAAGWQAFRDHAFLGVGSGAYGATVLRVVDIPYVAHNTYLSVLVELGAIGALVFIALLATMVWCAVRMEGLERRLWITLLATWGIGVSALTWEYRKATWLVFALVVAHAYVCRDNPVHRTGGMRLS